MSDLTEERLPEPEPERAQEEQPANSMMEQLRKQHQELTDNNTVDMPLPGYHGMLVARYRILTIAEDIAPITRKVTNEFRDIQEAQLWGTVDTLIAACEGMFYDDGSGELKPLSESFGEGQPPVRYDERLAEFLAINPESARQLVLQVFGGNEPMLMSHGRELSNWMTTQSRGAMEGFMRGM